MERILKIQEFNHEPSFLKWYDVEIIKLFV